MNTNNIILKTDSYKLSHWKQYPKDTETVYSYFESRGGAEYPYTVFFGLQHILKTLEGKVVDWEDLSEASALAAWHFGDRKLFNYQGWAHIVEEHNGHLPVRIKAVPEGTPVPTGNVLMTVENTCPKCFWLTNALESLLTHVWYPSTVATRSREVKAGLASLLDRTADSRDGLDFMLQDFGYRGAASDDAAAIGGAGHLVNFKGSDTLPALLLAIDTYNAAPDTLGYSVPATEHSVMTARGSMGEFDVVQQLIDEHPTGILSCVADSYNIYEFVEQMGSRFKKQIMERDGTFVVRPDSITDDHPNPGSLTVWIVNKLWNTFGGTTNRVGFKVLDSHVRVLWGDGIDTKGIMRICDRLILHGFSIENMVFGMGGGLLQKLNRDTQRFAFKCSAQKRSGEWHDVWKQPLDSTKSSKKGRLALVKNENGAWSGFTTAKANLVPDGDDILETVFENGKITKKYTFDEIRENAKV